MGTKAELYIAQMEETDIMMNPEMTFTEYSENLIRFQEMVTKLVMGNEYEEGMRIDEAIFRLEARARAKGINYDPQFRKGIAALRTVSKEVAISMAGKKAENIVARTLEFVERPHTKMYRNVYISNGREETELDNVILTDSGIIILEVKNIKDDVKITEQGRLVHSGDACYDKQPLCEKMQTKRRLLKEKLESVMREKSLNIPVRVESLIVFSTPKGVRINVDDRFHKEKWCYRSGLKNKLEYYVGLVSYDTNQLEELDALLGDIETQVKRFAVPVDFNTVRMDIAEALAMFDEDAFAKGTSAEPKKVIKQVAKKPFGQVLHVADEYAKRVALKRTVAVMAGVFTTVACASLLGTSAFLSRR